MPTPWINQWVAPPPASLLSSHNLWSSSREWKEMFPQLSGLYTNPSFLSLRSVPRASWKGTKPFPNAFYPLGEKPSTVLLCSQTTDEDKSSINASTTLIFLGCNILLPEHLIQTRGKNQRVRGVSSASAELPKEHVMPMHGFWIEVLIKTQEWSWLDLCRGKLPSFLCNTTDAIQDALSAF